MKDVTVKESNTVKINNLPLGVSIDVSFSKDSSVAFAKFEPLKLVASANIIEKNIPDAEVKSSVRLSWMIEDRLTDFFISSNDNEENKFVKKCIKLFGSENILSEYTLLKFFKNHSNKSDSKDAIPKDAIPVFREEIKKDPQLENTWSYKRQYIDSVKSINAISEAKESLLQESEDEVLPLVLEKSEKKISLSVM